MVLSIDALQARIAERADASPETSYTAKLLAAGAPKCAQKLGEEAVETVIAAIQNDKREVIKESADLLYHLLVLWQVTGVTFDEVMAELDRRTVQSGLEEKAARGRQ